MNSIKSIEAAMSKDESIFLLLKEFFDEDFN